MKQRPVERLEKTLARVAKEQGLAQERLRRWVSFLALCGVLERAVSEGVLDNYYLKGGAAMELRFAEGARATKDIDIGVSGERAARLALFQTALALGFDPSPDSTGRAVSAKAAKLRHTSAKSVIYITAFAYARLRLHRYAGWGRVSWEECYGCVNQGMCFRNHID